MGSDRTEIEEEVACEPPSRQLYEFVVGKKMIFKQSDLLIGCNFIKNIK